jgi:HYR domain-containing protein/type IX secretion system substrate protein/SprB-like repeat protein
MKKKINSVYALFWALLAAFLFMSYSNNPPNGRTGAPPSNNTCSASAGGCHSGGAMSGNITLTGLPATIAPGTTYPLTVKLTRTNPTPQLGGFQATILDAGNSFAGSFSNAGPNSTLQIAGGITYFEHNPAVFFGGGNDITYTVDWTSPASGSDTITMYTAGNFANGNGNSGGDYIATQTASGTLISGGVITVNVSGTNVSCFGGSDGTATALPSGGGGGPYTYTWSNGGNTQTIGDLPAGTYTVTVTNGAGGNGMGTVTLTQPPLLTAAIINQTNINCLNPVGSATAQGGGGMGGYSYAWPNGSQGQTAILPAGTHIVTVTDANDCTATATATIEVEPDTEPPIAIAENLTVALDENGMAAVTPSLVDDGSFDNCALDSMALNAGAFDCNNLGENEVVLTVWDAAGNSATDTALVTVVDETPPVIICPENLEVASCDTITVEYGIPAATDNCGVEEVFIISGLPSGATFPEGVTEITWGATDQSGNEAACTFSIAIISNLELTASITEPSCADATDGSAAVLPSGGAEPYQYAWDDDAQQTTQTATGLSAGTYSVTITDAIGCETVATIVLTEPETVLITVDEVTPETGSNMDGAVSVTVAGGTGALSIEWSLNGNFFSGDEDLTALSAGTYVLHVTDENGCTAEDSVAVESITGTADPALESRISVFPNPVSGELHLAFELGAAAEVRIGMYDLDGRLVLPRIRGKLQSKNLSMDMSHLAPGIYIVKMVVNEAVVVKRVVVSR